MPKISGKFHLQVTLVEEEYQWSSDLSAHSLKFCTASSKVTNVIKDLKYLCSVVL